LLPAVAVTIGLGILAICTGVWITTTLSFTWALTRSKGEISTHVPVTSIDHELATCKEDKFDIGRSMQMSYVKLIGMLYGDASQQIATALLTLVLVIAMWSYAAIFASSMAAVMPIPFIGGTCDVYGEWADQACASRYYLYLFLFALLMVTLSLIQLREQKSFQLPTFVCAAIGIALLSYVLVSNSFTVSGAAAWGQDLFAPHVVPPPLAKSNEVVVLFCQA